MERFEQVTTSADWPDVPKTPTDGNWKPINQTFMWCNEGQPVPEVKPEHSRVTWRQFIWWVRDNG